MAEILKFLRKLEIPYTGGMVFFDWFMTIIAALIIAKKINICFIVVLFLLLLLSIYMHIIFNQPTMTNYYLGLSEKPKRNV